MKINPKSVCQHTDNLPDTVYSPRPEQKDLPLQFLLSPKKKRPSLGDRLVADLIRQEARETDPHNKADLRIAQVTILKALKGEADPFDAATRAILHCSASQVWPNIVQNRKNRLGAEYFNWYDRKGNSRPDIPARSPKKAVQSVKKEEVA